MSNYTGYVKHPVTGEKVEAIFLDDYFGKHEYGVKIVGEEKVYRGDEVEIGDKLSKVEE